MFTIEPITKEQVDLLKVKLKAVGSTIEPIGLDKYRIQGNGITAKVDFDEATKAMIVEIVNKPWAVSEDIIKKSLEVVIHG